MNGTKLPEEIKELSKEKEITLFIDGDRGGRLIVKNVTENANIAFIAVAPDGKEVEELTEKEILVNLRKRISVRDFLREENRRGYSKNDEITSSNFELNEKTKARLKEIFEDNRGSDRAIILNSDLKEIRSVYIKQLSGFLGKIREKTAVLVIDGSVTKQIINSAEEVGIQLIVAKNFNTTDTKIKLLSF